MEFNRFVNLGSTRSSIGQMNQNSIDQNVQLTFVDNKNSIESSSIEQLDQRSNEERSLNLNLTLGLSNQFITDRAMQPNIEQNNIINQNNFMSTGNPINFNANYFNGAFPDQGNMNGMMGMNQVEFGGNMIRGGANLIPTNEWLTQANALRAAAGNHMQWQPRGAGQVVGNFAAPVHHPVAIIPSPAVAPALLRAAAPITAAGGNWSSNPLVRMNPMLLQPAAGYGVDDDPHMNQVVLIDVPPRRAHRARNSIPSSVQDKRCSNFNCNTSDTPMWRRGPLGAKTLCNACGIKYRKELDKRKVREAERILERERQIEQLAKSINGNATANANAR